MQPAFERQWEQSLSHLVDYKNTFGNLNVPKSYISSDGFKLGAWVHRQRISYRQGKLLNNRILKLEALGLSFDGMKHYKLQLEQRWENGFSHLQEYKNQFGDVHVNCNYICPDTFNLGKWVNYQKRRYHHNKLEEERINKLLNLGLSFGLAKSLGLSFGLVNSGKNKNSSKVSLSPIFLNGINHFMLYVKETGHCNIKAKYISPDGFHLGRWVVRTRKKARQGMLSDEEFIKLKEVGFCFTSDYLDTEKKWRNGFERYLEYKKQHGKDPSLYFISPDGYKLGVWVYSQRTAFYKGLLSDSKTELLLDAGLVFNVVKKHWEKGYKSLIDYIALYGTPSPPAGYISSNGFRLGQWAITQRQLYIHGKLSQEKINDLNAVQFDFRLKARFIDLWEKGFQHLNEFFDKYGNSKVPLNYASEDGYKLGFWVQNQRKEYYHMPLYRIKKLESIGFVWKNALCRK